jgi:hypothetical protein
MMKVANGFVNAKLCSLRYVPPAPKSASNFSDPDLAGHSTFLRPPKMFLRLPDYKYQTALVNGHADSSHRAKEPNCGIEVNATLVSREAVDARILHTALVTTSYPDRSAAEKFGAVLEGRATFLRLHNSSYASHSGV